MNEENTVEVSQVNEVPETQIDDYTSNAVEELVIEAEKKDEAAQEVKKEEKVETNKFASKFAALSRREKQLKAKEAELSKKLADLEKAQVSKEEKAKIPEPKKPEDFDRKFQREFRRDPFGALEKLGIPYDKLTELAINDKKLTPDMQMKLMREEIEDGYKDKFEQLEKRLTDKEEQEKVARYDKIQKNYMNKISNFVEKNVDTYEFIQANGAYEVVYDVVEKHYKDSGKILTIKEAADAVEAHFEGEAEKLLKLKKVGSRLQSYMQQQEKAKEPSKKPVTLTNAHSQQSFEEQPKRQLTDEESKREIAKLLRWTD